MNEDVSFTPKDVPKSEKRADFLREEIRSLRDRRERRLRFARTYVVIGLLCLIAAVIIYYQLGGSYWWMGVLYGALFLLTPLLRSPSEYDTGILTLENELDLLETTQVSPEQRAEKLFKHHQYELQKYYDQTLRHSKWIFLVGLICIFVGFGTIAATFYFVVTPSAPQKIEEKILVASLGAVGSVLANFIAVIYLRMFSEILKAVADFHNRLVGTHNLYFANFMSTKITEVGSRDAVLADISKNLTKA